jgi:exodeoxyribonuclease VII large subunit
MAEAASPLPKQTIRVGQLTRYLKYLVERDELLAALSVQGEISDYAASPSGHTYFTLKEGSSQVSCVMFRREAMNQREILRELGKGISVVVGGFLTLYEPRGAFQIYVERIEALGEGVSARRFEKLRAQLEQEGLFAPERKRQLPKFPAKLALVTSPQSQAYHDVLHRLKSQYPFVLVIEVGVSVQGDGAAEEMSMAIDVVNRLTDADLILLVRGGGAPDELAPFNEERLARAIFASRIPVVTGVGHEKDNTIVDLVADRRAATPSLAAAIAVPDIGALVQQSGQLHARMGQIIRQRLGLERSRLVEANRAILRASPQNRLRTQRQQADELSRALLRSATNHIAQKRSRLTDASRSLSRSNPEKRILLTRQKVRELEKSLARNSVVQITSRRSRLLSLQAQLAALDPLAVLARGYSVLTDSESGEVIRRIEQARPHATLRARVSDGRFHVTVLDP